MRLSPLPAAACCLLTFCLPAPAQDGQPAERAAGPSYYTRAGLRRLNEERSQLPVRLEQDFSKSAPGKDALFLIGQVTHKEGEGIWVEGKGDNGWNASGIGTTGIDGDFDITAEFSSASFAEPGRGRFSGIMLQVQLDHERPIQVNSVLMYRGRDRSTASFHINDPPKVFHWETGFDTQTLEALRLARRGNEYILLGRQPEADTFDVIGIVEKPAVPVLTARLLLHTGANVGTSKYLLKSLTIHADEFSPYKDLPAKLTEPLVTRHDPWH